MGYMTLFQWHFFFHKPNHA